MEQAAACGEIQGPWGPFSPFLRVENRGSRRREKQAFHPSSVLLAFTSVHLAAYNGLSMGCCTWLALRRFLRAPCPEVPILRAKGIGEDSSSPQVAHL